MVGSKLSVHSGVSECIKTSKTLRDFIGKVLSGVARRISLDILHMILSFSKEKMPLLTDHSTVQREIRIPIQIVIYELAYFVTTGCKSGRCQGCSNPVKKIHFRSTSISAVVS